MHYSCMTVPPQRKPERSVSKMKHKKKMFIIVHKTLKLYRDTASRAKPALWGQSSLSCITVKEKQCPPSFGI